LDDYKAMVGFLEEQTGNKLDYDRLAEILTEVDKQDALITDIEDMHTLRPTPLSPIHNLGLYVGRYTFSGRKEYTRLLEAIYETAKNRAKAGVSGLKSGEEKLRILMIYIDHYNLGMNYWKWFDDNGIAHMGSHLSHHFRDTIDYTLELPGSSYGIDTSSPESMLNSIAQMNARNPMVRSIRGPYDGPSMWLEENLALGKHFSVDCMVFNGTPGCRNTWSNNKLIARDLEKQGYPVHIMNDDAFDDRMESWETTKERLEEFLQVRGLL
jgi:benzoyl-CoA reductase/2-hydroxyglutaryl-CoA dehydratase subunit BcrC/BadD/HgdB